MEFRDNLSIPSNEKAETVSSLASGGENSAKNPAEIELERSLHREPKGHENNPSSANTENIPVQLTELKLTKPVIVPSDNEELFQPSEDNFFKLRVTAFNSNSGNNSSCDSFSEQTNGVISYSRNSSLSPTPGSGEHNMLLVNNSTLRGAESKTSLGSGNFSVGEDTLDSKSQSGDCMNTPETSDSKTSDMPINNSKGENIGQVNGHTVDDNHLANDIE